MLAIIIQTSDTVFDGHVEHSIVFSLSKGCFESTVLFSTFGDSWDSDDFGLKIPMKKNSSEV